ncbi:uncharacterized protein LOC128956032 [Oppia nitens]|uniref:uncharacterized protein LOC128956032 n=1 Tax=Oppia nitens TaxID=1686743 RepID=UPI0023D9C4CA|nr:uncharacterized protein LOC128956032 [Oppia nitens]
MSAVWVIVTIPTKEYELKIKEKEKQMDSLKRNKIQNNLNELDTIREANENFNNEYRNKIDNFDKEMLFETIVEESLAYLGITDAIWQKSKNGNYSNISFYVDLEESDAVIQYFKTKEVGNKFGSSIGIIPFSLFCYEDDDLLDEIELNENGDKNEMRKLSHFKALQNTFLKSVTARLTVAQVVDNVRSGASLTFDFVCYVIFASWIAAMGLLDNSVVSLVASMLVSPMMGPVMALTFGTIIKDGSLRRLGFKNLGFCFLITILFGYFFGLIALNFTEHWNGDQEWPTNMMRERGLPRVVWVGTLVAFPSGCAVAISLLSGNEASLVGVAISVSLLPPAVNAGLLWAFSTLKTLYSLRETPIADFMHPLSNERYTDYPPSLIPDNKYQFYFNKNIAIETAILGVFSLILSLINITNIFIGALILLKIKEIAPLSTMSPTTRRFFQEDIKIVREYNAEHGGNSDNMGEQVLKEWADMNGINANELLANTPEARVTQFQTLTDIIRDVEEDQVYKSIQRTRISVHNGDLMRRMSQSLFQPPPLSSGLIVEGRDGRRRSSAISINMPNIRISDVEMGAIHHRRNGRQASRLSQINPAFIGMDENYDRFSMREPLSSRPTTPTIKMPLSAGLQPLNANVFTFGDNFHINDINRRSRRGRPNSSSLLRRSLNQSERSPYSLWPSANRMSPATVPRFMVTPVTDSRIQEIIIDSQKS